MKKISIILVILLGISLFGCSSKKNEDPIQQYESFEKEKIKQNALKLLLGKWTLDPDFTPKNIKEIVFYEDYRVNVDSDTYTWEIQTFNEDLLRITLYEEEKEVSGIVLELNNKDIFYYEICNAYGCDINRHFYRTK